MVDLVRDKEGLTPQQARFAALLAQGRTPSRAYREASGKLGTADKNASRSGAAWARNPLIAFRVQKLMEEAKITDVEVVSANHRQFLSDMDSARKAGNHTALMGYNRQLATMDGRLKETLTVESKEQRMDDETLIKSLAKGDDKTAAMLRALLGREGFA